MRIVLVAAVAASALSVLTALSTPCLADTIVIEQSGKKFSQTEVTIKKGDSITFANKDPITHNVYSLSPGNTFDVKMQKAGESSDVKFDSVGDADVQCAIHPSMKLKVHVTK
jgi:plastocyanin